jgi:hypothetical protein
MWPPGSNGSPAVRDSAQIETELSIISVAASSTSRDGRPHRSSAANATWQVATITNPTIITGRFVWSAAAETWTIPAAPESTATPYAITRALLLRSAVCGRPSRSQGTSRSASPAESCRSASQHSTMVD